MKQLYKTTILFIGISTVAFLLSTMLATVVSAQREVTEQSNTSQSIIHQRLISELRRIESLQTRLNANVFNDEVFNSLRDWSRPLEEVDRSRFNPFAPIGQ
jgi:hypothetical protein